MPGAGDPLDNKYPVDVNAFLKAGVTVFLVVKGCVEL